MGHRIEVFVSSCPLCREAVDIVRAAMCPECRLEVYNITGEAGVHREG